MPPSVTVAAFVFGLVLSIAALIGRDIKIVAVEIPALTGGTRFSVGILGVILMAFGLFNIPERFFAPPSPTAVVAPTTKDIIKVRDILSAYSFAEWNDGKV